MQQFVHDYLHYLETIRYFSPNTLRVYRVHLTDALSVFGVVIQGGRLTREKLTPSLLREYRKQIAVRNISGATMNLKFSAVASWCAWMVRQGILEANPSLGLRRLRLEKRLPRMLTFENVTKLLSLPKRNSVDGCRDFAILEVLYSGGLRVSELVSLNLDDLDLKEGLLTVSGKGGKRRFGVLGPRAIDALAAWLSWRGRLASRVTLDPVAVFVNYYGTRLCTRSIQRIYTRYAQGVPLQPRGSPHCLRHSFASHMLANGASLVSVKDLLGHSNLQATCIYARLTQNQLRQVFDDKHPRA